MIIYFFTITTITTITAIRVIQSKNYYRWKKKWICSLSRIHSADFIYEEFATRWPRSASSHMESTICNTAPGNRDSMLNMIFKAMGYSAKSKVSPQQKITLIYTSLRRIKLTPWRKSIVIGKFACMSGLSFIEHNSRSL